MKLGAFSVSLAVNDLDASRKFYEVLGFGIFAGDASLGHLIMKNGHTVIGLFHGMFEGNILTFNPGWDQNAEPAEDFTDIRKLQEALQATGVALEYTADPEGEGPASFMVLDPDGNPVLVDQHVNKPA